MQKPKRGWVGKTVNKPRGSGKDLVESNAYHHKQTHLFSIFGHGCQSKNSEMKQGIAGE